MIYILQIRMTEILVYALRITHFLHTDTTTTKIYTLSLHDALPICVVSNDPTERPVSMDQMRQELQSAVLAVEELSRSEEHTSELQSPVHFVCRLVLEKKQEEANSFADRTALHIIDSNHIVVSNVDI